MRYMLASLLAGICLAATCDSRASDCAVIRGTTIESQRPIWLLVAEAGLGVLNGRDQRARDGWLEGVGSVDTALRIDGRPAPGIGGMARAAWRLVGFLVWDGKGEIERRTVASVNGHVVNIHDTVENGRVWVRVTVGPPLGDPRVRCAILELEATEDVGITLGGTSMFVFRDRRWWDSRTRIQVTCAAVIDLPGDRCRLVRRIATRIAEREAGPELSGRVRDLESAGREAVQRGDDAMPKIVARFIEEICK